MCDFVPGELLISHDNSDEAAAGLVGRIREKEFPHIDFDASLDERLRDARLPVRKDISSSFYKLRVPEGEEQFKGEFLHSLYAEHVRSKFSGARVPPFLSDTRRAFNIVPNSILSTCFSFAQPQHHNYKALFGWTGPSPSTKRICIIDSGISSTAGFKIASKRNFLDSRNKDDVSDEHPVEHGTALAEIIRDLCPDAPLVIYKVVNSQRRATEWDTLAALVVDSGANIINMSLAFGLEDFECSKCGRQSHSSRSAVFEKLINDLSRQNVIVVAAAGNKAEPRLSFPARFANVVAIEAITQKGKLASYTNRGAIDSEGNRHSRVFVLPGGNREMGERAKPTEWMAVSNGEDLVGTSFAAAYASAIIAHTWQHEGRNGSADKLIARIAANADKELDGYNFNDFGNGLMKIA
jgi:subtilisin family serine protease